MSDDVVAKADEVMENLRSCVLVAAWDEANGFHVLNECGQVQAWMTGETPAELANLLVASPDLIPELRDALVAARVERDQARAEVERLIEQLIDARVATVKSRVETWEACGAYAVGELYDHLGMSTDGTDYDAYLADPRGFMRQKITEEQQC